jgi:3-hydroxyacyl-CoA dehydrogenase
MSKTVACIGAGLVGRAWAVVFARAGYDVVLYDQKPGEVRDRAFPGIRATFEMLAAGGALAQPVDTLMKRVRDAASIPEAVAGADHVQESVREDVGVKREVFATIAATAAPDAILASSTSAIPGSEFLLDIRHPERALVAHPVNPPSLIPLVEICPTPETSGESVQRCRRLLEGAGMKPIVLNKEVDGFILNRLQYTLVAEALHLVGEGYCSAEDIDRVVTDGLALRWAFIGPFTVAHLNASDGLAGFVDRLGPMMRRMGADARTDYDWTTQQIAEIHAGLAARIPIPEIASSQQERDRRILALLLLKEELAAGSGQRQQK